MQSGLAQLQTTLKGSGRSLTLARRTVFEILSDHDALSIGELIDKVGVAADRASVYRTVQLFEDLGVVHRVQIGWKYKLELSDSFASHHHHMTCLNCGTVYPLNEDPALEHQLDALARRQNFQPTGHQLEIRGYCRNCHLR